MSRLLIELLEEKAEQLKSENKNISGEELKELISSFDQDLCIEYDKLNSNERIKNKELENNRNIKEYEIKAKQQEIMFDSVIKTGMLALKTSLTINAGASTAFLSFIGYLIARGNFELVSLKSLSEVLYLFSLGAFFASLSTGSMYFAQFLYSRAANKTLFYLGMFFHLATIILIIASYWFFFDGLIKSRDAFLEVDTKINQNISIITEPYYYINKESL